MEYYNILKTNLFLSRYLDAAELSRYLAEEDFVKSDFGPDFKWGVAASSLRYLISWGFSPHMKD